MNVAEQDKNRSRSHQRLIYTKGERCKKKENKRKQKIMEKKQIKTKPGNCAPTRGIEPRSPA